MEHTAEREIMVNIAASRRDEKVMQMYVENEERKKCGSPPGDPASWPLDQREKRSAKIVFEDTITFIFDVCLDYPLLDWY